MAQLGSVCLLDLIGRHRTDGKFSAGVRMVAVAVETAWDGMLRMAGASGMGVAALPPGRGDSESVHVQSVGAGVLFERLVGGGESTGAGFKSHS
jgi:hypothetical protein